MKLELPLEFHRTCYDKHGVEVNDNDPYVCAKKLVSNRTDKAQYLALSDGRSLYNPREPDKTRKWNFRRIPEIAFNLYIRFLKTTKTTYLVQAQRVL